MNDPPKRPNVSKAFNFTMYADDINALLPFTYDDDANKNVRMIAKHFTSKRLLIYSKRKQCYLRIH